MSGRKDELVGIPSWRAGKVPKLASNQVEVLSHVISSCDLWGFMIQVDHFSNGLVKNRQLDLHFGIKVFVVYEVFESAPNKHVQEVFCSRL